MAATMKDIARMTGLGLATISKYLNGGNVRPKNKKLIDDAVRKLNFVPNEFARSLKTRQSRTIGVLIPELANTFITSIVSMMEDNLRKNDYAVIVCDCRSDAKLEKEAVHFLLHKQVDGLINMPTDQSGAHLEIALANNTPIVLVDRMINALNGQVSGVVIDNADAAEKGARRLLRAGHTDIGIILGNSGLYTTEYRRDGYMAALAARSIAPREEYIVHGEYSMQGGYAATKKLLTLKNPPTAIFATNYEMTLGALLALNEAHMAIPEDMSFIGFDRLDVFEAIYPSLTIMHQPLNAIGETVAQLMLAALSADNPPKQRITLSASLQEGSSVKDI